MGWEDILKEEYKQYYLSIIPFGFNGESIEHLKYQHFIHAEDLETAKHRASRFANRWLNDNTDVDYITFKLYDEDDEVVYSGEIN